MPTLLREHDGKRCYRIPPHFHGRMIKLGLFTVAIQEPGPLRTKQFLGGYLLYTGSWYLYDVETGEEVASFSGRTGAWDVLVEPHRVCDLVPDPEC